MTALGIFLYIHVVFYTCLKNKNLISLSMFFVTFDWIIYQEHLPMSWDISPWHLLQYVLDYFEFERSQGATSDSSEPPPEPRAVSAGTLFVSGVLKWGEGTRALQEPVQHAHAQRLTVQLHMCFTLSVSAL